MLLLAGLVGWYGLQVVETAAQIRPANRIIAAGRSRSSIRTAGRQSRPTRDIRPENPSGQSHPKGATSTAAPISTQPHQAASRSRGAAAVRLALTPPAPGPWVQISHAW